MAQLVKNLPAMQERKVQSLGLEDPLEKGTTTHSSILACRIPWTEEPGGLQAIGSQRVGHNCNDLASICCNPLGSSVDGISQARTHKWAAISFSRGSSRPRD